MKSRETQMEDTAEPRLRGISHAWRALRSRNFRLFFCGQAISTNGTWMMQVAISWLVYRLTKSPMLLGAVGFAGQIPSFLLAPLAGVIADRFDRRQMMIWTQSAAMVVSFSLAALTLSGHITITHLLVLSVFQGVINAFDMPVRQSLLIRLVDDKSDLPNAIAVNSTMLNSARMIGPSVAGMVIAVSNEGWCFTVDGFSFMAVIASLMMLRIPIIKPTQASAGMMMQLREGWTYVADSAFIRTVMLLCALLSLMGFPFLVLMPLFAAQVLHGGPYTLGFLMSSVGVGSLACAITMAMRHSVRGLMKMLPVGATAFGVGLICFGFSNTLWISMPMLFVTGFGMMQGLTTSNTLLQTVIDEKMRGRVMSYFGMAYFGMVPFGSLLSGTLAHAIGAQNTVIISGIACILGALLFCTQLKTIRREIRPVYERLGILPQTAVVSEAAAAGN